MIVQAVDAGMRNKLISALMALLLIVVIHYLVFQHLPIPREELPIVGEDSEDMELPFKAGCIMIGLLLFYSLMMTLMFESAFVKFVMIFAKSAGNVSAGIGNEMLFIAVVSLILGGFAISYHIEKDKKRNWEREQRLREIEAGRDT